LVHEIAANGNLILLANSNPHDGLILEAVLKPIQTLIILVTLTMLFTTASAWDDSQVVAGNGSLQQHIWINPSPTPGYCYWESDSITEPIFQASNTDGHGNMDCPYDWFVHCDNDSLVYQGTWPFIDSSAVNGAEYIVELSCSVLLNSGTRMSAGRQINSGELDTDEHFLTITYPDNTIVQVLNTDPGPNQVQLDLQPGEYLVTLHVRAYQHKTFSEVIDPYEGYVWLRWEEPGVVAATTVGWNSVKAYYR